MAPTAHVHRTLKGRTQLRIPARRGDTVYFAEVEQALSECDGVQTVQANPLTGRVLLLHEADLDTVIQYAYDLQLFTVRTTRPAHAMRNLVTGHLGRADRYVQHVSHGTLDLDDVALAGLMGISLIQLFRRKALHPTAALLSYAVALMAVYHARRTVE